MNNVCIGVLAHADAGKTTTIEGLLAVSGTIRKSGRVDAGNTQMDYEQMEKARGITIHSKEGHLDWKGRRIQILDTPGHADFSSEMERVLPALDMAVLVVSALNGVQAHTKTIWKCLEAWNIPTLIFVNKMDAARMDKETLLKDLEKLSPKALPNDLESLAMADDDLLEKYLAGEDITSDIAQRFARRRLFPVLFGSALRQEGLEQLLDALVQYGPEKEWPKTFGMRVYKVSHDAKGALEAHVKVTGGQLLAKQVLEEGVRAEQLRIRQGAKDETVSVLAAGSVGIMIGANVQAGQVFGYEKELPKPILRGQMEYELLFPDGTDALTMLPYVSKLALQDPMLEVRSEDGSIFVRLMGAVQQETVAQALFEMAGIRPGFGPGKIVYQETIAATSVGVGHFEPLRHYAEVHVLLEPNPGKGIQVVNGCRSEDLPLRFQAQIMNALREKRHKGVKAGFALTDVKITLLAGKGHAKHTQGHDFWQAACRAVRQGLMMNEPVVLQPAVQLNVEMPAEDLGRILADLEMRQMACKVLSDTKVQAFGPLANVQEYFRELPALSHGLGKADLESAGTMPADVQTDYDPREDLKNSPDSVFCVQGRGETVPWDEVYERAHIPVYEGPAAISASGPAIRQVSDDEAARAFARAGSNNRKEKKMVSHPKKEVKAQTVVLHKPKERILLVDACNMIYGWQSLAGMDFSLAKEKLLQDLANWQAMNNAAVTVVFDSWKVKDKAVSQSMRGALEIVYTKSGQTADSWIEQAMHKHAGKEVWVATSDGLIQNAALAAAARRISAREMELSVQSAYRRIKAQQTF